jgi:hypothetical protein
MGVLMCCNLSFKTIFSFWKKHLQSLTKDRENVYNPIPLPSLDNGFTNKGFKIA